MEINRKQPPLKNRINDFIAEWSRFPIDLWWRKKYHIPFNSPRHRSMNFIDMAIEFYEELMLNKANASIDYSEEEEYIDDVIKGQESIHMTSEEIDEDYDSLDLSDFDKKE